MWYVIVVVVLCVCCLYYVWVTIVESESVCVTFHARVRVQKVEILLPFFPLFPHLTLSPSLSRL